MRVETGKSLSNGIKTAVYYLWDWKNKKPLFPPPSNRPINTVDRPFDLSKVSMGNIVQYKSSNTSIGELDFKEYEYKYIQDQGKFGDVNLAEFLGDDALSLCCSKDTNLPIPSELEKITTFGVPSIYINDFGDSELKFGFFTSKLLSSGDTIYQFHAPENCFKIELYGEVIDSNTTNKEFRDISYYDRCDDTIKFNQYPVMSVILGPGYSQKYNQDWFYYYSSDKPRTEDLIEEPLVKYRGLIEEITCSKVVTIVTKSNGEVGNAVLNISQQAFQDSKNPMRNLHEIAIRNDDWYGMKDCINQVGKKDDSLYDLTSGTLLGNSIVESVYTPILSSKKEIIKSKGNYYSSAHEYKEGEIVKYRGRSYVSLRNKNHGNIPGISPEWLSQEVFSETFTTRVELILDPPYAGKLNKKYLTINSKSDKLMFFSYFPGIGFKFNLPSSGSIRSNIVSGFTGTTTKYADVPTKDYHVEDYLLGEGRYQFTFKTDILRTKGLSLGKIVITPNDCKQYIYLQFRFEDNIYCKVRDPREIKSLTDPNNYIDLINTPDFIKNDAKSIRFNRTLISNTTSEYMKSAEINRNFELTRNELDLSCFNNNLRVLVTGVDAFLIHPDGQEFHKTLVEDLNSPGVYIDDDIDSSILVYTVNFVSKKITSKIMFNTEEWEFETICPSTTIGGSFETRFYSLIPGITTTQAFINNYSVVIFEEVNGVIKESVYNLGINNVLDVDENGVFKLRFLNVQRPLTIYINDKKK